MNKSFLNLITVVASIVILSACQNPVVERSNASDSKEMMPPSWVKLPAQAVVLGGAIKLPDSQGSSSDNYTIQALYTSALGKVCMQASENQTGLLRVFCKTDHDYWQPMPTFNSISP